MASRRVLCESCTEKKMPAGEREIYARCDEGPAEFQRLIVGVAKMPTAVSRFMTVNGKRIFLPPDQFDCDQCSAAIKPGDKCSAQTIWCEGQDKIEGWEEEFIAA